MKAQALQFQFASNAIANLTNRIKPLGDLDFPKSLVEADARLSRSKSDPSQSDVVKKQPHGGVEKTGPADRSEKTVNAGKSTDRANPESSSDAEKQVADARNASDVNDGAERQEKSSKAGEVNQDVNNTSQDDETNDGDESINDQDTATITVDAQALSEQAAVNGIVADGSAGNDQDQTNGDQSPKKSASTNQTSGSASKVQNQSDVLPREQAQAGIDAQQTAAQSVTATEQSSEISGDAEVVSDSQQFQTTRESTGNSTSSTARVEPTVVTVENAGALQTDTSGANLSGKSAAAPPALPQSQLDDADADAALSRVSRGLQTAVNQRGGTVTIRLHPPELGFVRVEMEILNGVVKASIQSDAANVRSMLSQQVAQLRAGLEQQGLSVERLNVQALPQLHTGNQTQTSTDSQSQQEAARESFGDGRSRGHFRQGQSEGEQNGSDESRQETRRRQRGLRFNDALFGQLGN